MWDSTSSQRLWLGGAAAIVRRARTSASASLVSTSRSACITGCSASTGAMVRVARTSTAKRETTPRRAAGRDASVNSARMLGTNTVARRCLCVFTTAAVGQRTTQVQSGATVAATHQAPVRRAVARSLHLAGSMDTRPCMMPCPAA